ncbi:MAG TPA: HAMP domain-containing sensor histidine kinase [Candidatus Saccharimonadales bacterium]|nr:HAMP domain-containing sensor histidine kinase [Candidatus Saccharimonadales bacterium]
MFKSATLRLTLWYLAIAMAISLLFSIALYNVTTEELNRGLSSESRQIYSTYPVLENNPDFDFGPRPLFEQSAHRILLRLVGFNLLVLVGAGFSSYWLARRTLEPIEQAHEQQKRFTSDVSHELRTPLTAIRMESEVALLNSRSSSKELRETIESNLEEVGKLEALINNLLRLARLEADELQQNFKEEDSRTLVTLALDKVDKIASQRNVTIKTNGEGGCFYGDPDNLAQAIIILLDNAIKYSPEKTQVELNTFADDGNVSWQVIDHGPGIEPKSLEHIFDRFYRADTSRNKDQIGGYGLGLSIAKMIADVHKGTVTLSSKVGQGTTATLTVPKLKQPPTPKS